MLRHDSAVQYSLGEKGDGLILPEKYNGLGYQNLISIVFDLISYRDGWMRAGKSGTKDEIIEPLHLVLVEEPEAHLKRFSYNPNGDNVGIDSLSHEEVIKIGAEFISTEETMKKILVNKYPVLLIDESQDTKKELIDALLIVYEEKKDQWAIGMFGDTMQKIYQDGKDRLEEAIPSDWVRPVKVMNHRSSKRVVTLANSIRKLSDDKMQRSRSDAAEGFVRLFLANSSSNKESTEKSAARIMAELSSDQSWLTDDGYECLSVPFDEMERYATYVSDSSRFATHQGVKGLEFPRVMVILDDTESRGFLFSYEKLFGAKKQTATDLKNEKEGKDTSNRRTARLFYVACTRAMESLAVVAYSDNPELVKNTALNNGWFSEDEIQIIETQSVL